jgi:predicted nucleic acid binding AN1-type Zn finger protein
MIIKKIFLIIKMGKNRCFLDDCKRKKEMIIGNCKYCNHIFCLKHRLPEEHKCSNIDGMKDIKNKEIKKKLESEKCVTKKIQKI